jgi:ABC-type amino acid transport substrate-binding protein
LVNNYDSVVEEIKNTGVLKVAYSQNSPPFGFINKEGYWEGYCNFLSQELAGYLEKQLDLSFKPDIVFLPSSLNNSLVRNGEAHLECGANSMTQNLDNVSFSIPFFVTGNHFLIPKNMETTFNPNQSLQNFKVGVVNNSTTANFLREKYPQVKPIYFDEVSAIEKQIEALENGSIDAIINSKILLDNEVSALKNPENYQIVPLLPLNCDFYGLLLPKQDTQWIEIVNNFLSKTALTKQYFSAEIEDNRLKTLNYCLNIDR